MINNILLESLTNLEKYILKNKYKGYDRYDGLTSPLLKLPVFKKRKLRLYFQQAIKRLPVNLRHILFIPKGYNPVTLGLCLQAYVYLSRVDSGKQDFYKKEIDFLLNELIRLQSKNYSGACWGYDFEWAGRFVTIPAYCPTVVATGIITNALFENYKYRKCEKSLDLCISATKFVLNDLNKSHDGETYAFSYSPLDKQTILNTSMKGVRILAQAYSINNDQEILDNAKKVVNYVMKYQSERGAWSYAFNDPRQWVDNYHTGYILDCLDDYIKYCGDVQYREQLKKGFSYYEDHFIENGKIPKLYDNKTYPIDCTAAAQLILTFVKFGKIEPIKKVALWMIENMQSPQGYFYFRHYKNYINKVSFMRWSNAWMFVALSKLLFNINKETCN